ncbi:MULTISPECIES: type IV pilin-like G/H family protein [unclassified Microcoleus]|uniref:type IV pilin-like G/H family protein n=1 Tax=unclassified Microcoleus TaxID=2642155 RepID=UPI002FD3860F
MKTEFKARFLQHLNQKRQDKGFTLIELLVVIIIIGILSAIALPSFLNQANKAKQSEAKQYAGSMNRAQQASFAEQGKFGSNVEVLGLGIRTQTENYKYTVIGTGATIDSTTTQVGNVALGLSTALKSYIGGVALIQAAGASDKSSTAVLCESTGAGVAAPGPTLTNTPATAATLACDNTNYTVVSK